MNLKISTTYTFQTKSPAFLGSVIQNARLKQIMDADQARKCAPIDMLYAKILPTLPQGTPSTPDYATYYLFKGENGSDIVMADAWIIESSVVEVARVQASFYFPDLQVDDIAKIANLLRAHGFTGFTTKGNF